MTLQTTIFPDQQRGLPVRGINWGGHPRVLVE